MTGTQTTPILVTVVTQAMLETGATSKLMNALMSSVKMAVPA